MGVGLPLLGILVGKPFHLVLEIPGPEAGIQHCRVGMAYQSEEDSPFHPEEGIPWGLCLVQDMACSLAQIVVVAEGIVVAVADCIDLVAGCRLLRQAGLAVVPLFHLEKS